jgi:hydrogenase maturation protease
MSRRILVAGVGNIFRGDDGFGPAVVRRLEQAPLPEDVTLRDFGIRGIHLAYELVDGYDLLVLVDAVDRQAVPGSLFVIEPDLSGAGEAAGSMLDAHDLAPQAVLSLVPVLGGRLGRVLVVGCQPESVADGMGLSAPVAAGLDEAAALVRRLVGEPQVTVAAHGERRG